MSINWLKKRLIRAEQVQDFLEISDKQLFGVSKIKNPGIFLKILFGLPKKRKHTKTITEYLEQVTKFFTKKTKTKL
jgi:hypothetical protein